MLGYMLPVFAATDAPQAESEASGKRGGLTEFPGEEPTDEEITDWLKANLPVIMRNYGPAVRNETPFHLLKYLRGADDLSDYTRIDPASEEGKKMTMAQVQTHNRRITEAEKAVAERADSYKQGMKEYLDGLAQVVRAVMEPHAPLRLESMLERCPLAGAPVGTAHDGGKMIREIVALKGTLGIFEETRDHDRAVEALRDTPLPDGCPVSMYASTIETLMKHQPLLERPLTGVSLSKFIIRLMPPQNAAEGRAMIAKRTTAGTLDNRLEVIRECTAIVRQSMSPSSRAMAHAACRPMLLSPAPLPPPMPPSLPS